MSKKVSGLKKGFATIGLVLLLVSAATLYLAYNYVWKSNVTIPGSYSYFYIHTGDDFISVVSRLNTQKIIRNESSFIWVAKKKKYDLKVRPGRYKVLKGMNNNELVNLLRSGVQEPVKVTFNNVRTKKDLASSIGRQLEVDSTALLQMLNDTGLIASLGFNDATVISLFIPNTYEFYWTTNAQDFIIRMKKEYTNFWNSTRKEKADQIGLSQTEVATLASIVDEETNMSADRPIIAGVYVNRVKKSIPLEADPTLKFACGDFTIKRILNKDKEIDSPYNTYKYCGLPPGPIRIPSIEAIDAVLNYTRHNYIFFCAREDFSGYSNFAATYDEHLVNARKYQNALNRLNIKR